MPRTLSSFEKSEVSNTIMENLRNAVHRYKYIKVTLNDDNVYIGWLKCVDPMTGTLILVTLEGENERFEVKEVFFIKDPFIKTIDVLKEVDAEVKSFLLELYGQKVAAVDEDRRDRLVAFIKKSGMPIEISKDGRDIYVSGCTIQPPYDPDSCLGTKPMVVAAAGRVINLFDSRNEQVEAEVNSDVNPTEDSVNLNSGMQNLKLAEADSATHSEKSCSSKEYDLDDISSDGSSDCEGDFVAFQKHASNEDSSATEESYELVSNASRE